MPSPMPSESNLPTRRAFFRRAVLLTLTGALASPGLLLAACQTPTSPPKPSDATPVPPRPTLQPTSTPPRPPADVKPAALATPPLGPPKPGGALRWATDADPLDLDPHTAASVHGASAWADLTYQSLVMFDERLHLAPALAESWAMTSPTTWTFKLRQGVRFHDGSELDAEDVRVWFERLRAPETASPYRGWYSQIVKVEAQSRYEVIVTLSAPYAPLLATLASLRGSAIAPRRWLTGAGANTRLAAVGTGPFRISEYVPGSHITYQKHPDYWERGLPLLDTVTLQFAPDEAARLALLRSGQPGVGGSGAGPISAEAASRLKTDRTVTVLSAAGATQTVTIMNTRRAPFDDLRVRQAVALAVNRPAMLERVLQGAGQLTGPLPTGLGAWAIPPASLPYVRDVARARQLLSEAGHADGFEATIRTSAETLTGAVVSQALAGQLREIGITLRVESMSAEALAGAVAARDFELCSGRIGFLPDPDAYFSQHYHSNGGLNASGWSSRPFDDLVNGARTVMDPGQRKALYDEAASLLLDEAPLIWWFTENTVEAVSSDIKGYTPSFNGWRTGLKSAWLSR